MAYPSGIKTGLIKDEAMWQKYITVGSKQAALELLAEHGGEAKLIAGGTDLVLEMQKGLRPGVNILIDLSRVPSLAEISLDEDGFIHLGPATTHTDVVGSALLRERAMPLVQACWSVGSPQIRNRGTVIGNLVTASPANDTITPLMAMNASLVLQSKHAMRVVPLEDFYTGVRKTVLEPDEMVADVVFPALESRQNGFFIKQGLRRAQAISVLNVAVLLTVTEGVIESAAITLGAVAPTIVHAAQAEEMLLGRRLDAEVITLAGDLAACDAIPISDVRATADYRRLVVGVLVRRALESIFTGDLAGNVPAQPLLMRQAGVEFQLPEAGCSHDQETPIQTTINGKAYHLATGQNKTLIKVLREEAGLAGAKETCGEGECGACTVIMDGALVNSCLVPAPRAHGAQILTVEGLAHGEALHPLQEAFISKGAVQCGYCTPGFLLAGTKLLEEKPKPNRDDILWGLSGNLCRCTGYYKIIEAVEEAAAAMSAGL